MNRAKWSLLWLLFLAAILRLYGLNNISPPGLEHDEIAHWLINRDILAGHHAIYFTEAYGHEAGFHYLQAGFSYLTGDTPLTLRLPAAYCGLLVVAITYALGKKLFGREVALMAMGLTAVLFFPVFYSRLSLRAISLPAFSGLSAYFWWRAWDEGRGVRGEKRGARSENSRSSPFTLHSSPFALHSSPFILSGFFAGLSLHTYMAARAVPIFYALFIGYLAIFHCNELKQRWRGLVWFWLVFALAAAPLVVYLLTHPGAEFRITEIDAPLQALRVGDFRPILANIIKILGWFGLAGDPLWRQNVAGQPVFEPIVTLLFYGGLLWSGWNGRNGRFAFILLWLATSTIPSLVTIDAPSSIRMINSLPVLSLFPAILFHKSGELSTVLPQLSTVFRRFSPVLLIILFFTYGGWTIHALFTVWPNHPEVQFVWQTALTEAARYLDDSADTSPVAVGGWSPATMDEPTMQLTLRRDDLNLRYFGSDSMTAPINTLILPASQGSHIRILRPTARQLAPALEDQLLAWGAAPQTMEHFTLYVLPFPSSIQPQFSADVVFADQLRFLGYSVVGRQSSVVTYWQVLSPADGARRFFLHALDGAGDVLAQSDSLDAPAQFWQEGDVLVQYHELKLEEQTAESLRLGVYNPDTCPACQNLRTADGDPYILLEP